VHSMGLQMVSLDNVCIPLFHRLSRQPLQFVPLKIYPDMLLRFEVDHWSVVLGFQLSQALVLHHKQERIQHLNALSKVASAPNQGLHHLVHLQELEHCALSPCAQLHLP
jgi:hypothetical protein